MSVGLGLGCRRLHGTLRGLVVGFGFEGVAQVGAGQGQFEADAAVGEVGRLVGGLQLGDCVGAHGQVL